MKMTSEYSQFAKGIIYTPHNFSDGSMSEIGGTITEMRENAKKAFLNTNGQAQKDAFFAISQQIELNSEKIRSMSLTTRDINQMSEEIRNAEIYAKEYDNQNFYIVYTEDDSDICKNNDILFLVTN